MGQRRNYNLALKKQQSGILAERFCFDFTLDFEQLCKVAGLLAGH
jgi:hypothetical protein